VATGPADPELSDLGHAQARHLAEYLEGERVDRLITSPLRRAVQTAQPVSERLGLDTEVHEGVSEFDALSSEYVPIEELKATNDPRWQEMLDGTWQTEEGMTRHEFRDVVVPAIDEIIAGSSSQRVAVTCHGGVINAYFSHMLGLDEPMFFEPHYTSISRLIASSRGHRTLVSVNEIAHLPDARH
jgi:probable phosphoglycerate mutase